MKIFYLDNPAEHGSAHILRELGLQYFDNAVEKSVCAGMNGRVGLSSAHRDEMTGRLLSEMAQEHSMSDKCIIYCSAGEISVDVRDSADAWLRIELSPKEALTIPAETSRRVWQVLSPAFDAFVYFPTEEHPQLQFRFLVAADALRPSESNETRQLVCELCRQFYDQGWVTGTGGSISIRYGNRIYMTPSGVQKERIKPDELYVLDSNGSMLALPPHKPGQKKPKLSDCAPLFLHAYQQRGAGAVLHSHGVNVNLVTSLCEGKSEFRISHQEMIKGIDGLGYHDELVIPIIENTAYEYELADELGATIRQHPRSPAVLVRRHGMYVWGNSWEQAKRHAECIHYLFEIAVNMHRLGLDYRVVPSEPAAEVADGYTSPAPTPTKRKRANSNAHVGFSGHKVARADDSKQDEPHLIVLDIEGTTTPITFVRDVLFPYARERVEAYLDETWDTDETKSDVRALVEQCIQDQQDGVEGVVPIPQPSTAKKRVLRACVDNVLWQMSLDRKTSALKQLQGHIWRTGYQNGHITSSVFDDVPPALTAWVASGIRVCIYSSGSREAQRLLFQHTTHGDLRPFISAYFDTAIGNKRDASSYREICLTMGVQPSSALFVTDILEEAQAASAAGVQVVLSVREGNAPLPHKHGFTEISSFAQL